MKDFNHIFTNNPVDITLVEPQMRQLANFVRYKMYGKDVRESIARGFEWQSMTVSSLIGTVNSLSNLLDGFKKEFENTLTNLNQDSEVKNARVDAKGTAYATLKLRLDADQSNEISIGPTIKNDSSEHSMILTDFSQHSKGLHYEITAKHDETNLHGGFFTAQLSQLTFKEAQHE